MRPVWLCPLRLRERHDAVAALPARARARPTSTSASGAPCPIGPGAPTATQPRHRGEVAELGGHKSLYSDAYYDRETFDRLYGGANLAPVKSRYDPERPADRALREGGEETMTAKRPTIADSGCRAADARDALPLRFTAYDGSAAGPADAAVTAATWQRARAALPADRARRPRAGAGLRRRRPRASTGVHPGDPYEALRRCSGPASCGGRRRPSAVTIAPRARARPPDAAAAAAAGDAAALAPRRRGAAALARPATPRRSTTTTTCPTRSTR